MPEKKEKTVISRFSRLCTSSVPKRSAMRCKITTGHFLTEQHVDLPPSVQGTVRAAKQIK